MKTFTTAITIAALAINSAFAAPVELEDTVSKIVARSNYVKLCRNANFGECADFVKNTGQCVNIAASFSNVASSLDTYGANCTFFMDGGCGGAPWAVRGAWTTIPAQYNDNISSFRCDN